MYLFIIFFNFVCKIKFDDEKHILRNELDGMILSNVPTHKYTSLKQETTFYAFLTGQHIKCDVIQHTCMHVWIIWCILYE